MKDECLLCGAPLVYLERAEPMACALCGREEPSRARCEAGHYVCNDCHTGGMDAVVGVCLDESSNDPTNILDKLMTLPFCHMHGPEHHVLVGAALLTAYKNAGGEIDLPAALGEMIARGRQVPGGACGFWGACGAGISAGTFVSIVTKATPLAGPAWGLANRMTAAALEAIGSTGGPRCCKRDSHTAVASAVAFAREHLGVEMAGSAARCAHTEKNNQCLRSRCPYFAGAPRSETV